MVGSLSAVYYLSFAEVHQRVGRRLATVVRRSLIIVFLGCLYIAAGLALFRYYLEPATPRFDCGPDAGPATLCPPTPGDQLIVIGAIVLLLSFVFQIFWQDRSLGDPL